MEQFPEVSIVIVNLNGKHHLRECFNSILKLHYPSEKIEVILVDNGSTDGSVELVKQKYKWIKLICNSRNEGFAKPSNDGAKEAKGEYVAFINNDMRVQKDWLIELINSMRNNDAKCAGSVIVNWNGDLLDFAGGGIDFQGLGFQPDFKSPMKEMEPQLTADKDILFACGGAMIVEKELFLYSGGFDEDYFAYYEDVDLGWRLRILGCRIVLSVKSRAFHKHNSTSKTLTRERVLYLFERNKLYTCFKNYGEELFYKVFFPSLLLEIRETYIESDIDGYNYNIKNTASFDDEPVLIGHRAAMKLSALNEFVENISRTKKKRNFIQENRKAPDNEITNLLIDPFLVFGSESAELLSSEYDIVKLFEIDKLLNKEMKCKILLICIDNVGEKMAGTGIRYWEIAKSFAAMDKFEVTLACPDSCDICYDGIKIVTYSKTDAAQLLQSAKEATVVMLMGFILEAIPDLKHIINKKFVIIDIYDPFHIENMEIFKSEDRAFKNIRHEEATSAINYQLKIGDFFVCANEKQNDYWLGMLTEIGKVNPLLYESDQSCRKLIDIVPFGISDTAPVHTRNVLKGVWPGINESDKVLIWGGGIWNWFDPLTLIRAVKVISEKRNDVKLFFLGVRHPNPAITQMEMLNNAVKLADELGLNDKYVFFNFSWVDYNDRQNYLLEADIGVSNHFDTLETRFSFRTRILDYLWAGLPIVCTKGDYFANLVEEQNMGLAVDYKDEQQLANALLQILFDDEKLKKYKENVVRVANDYKWSKITKPIIDFCSEPMHYSARENLENKQEIPLTSETNEGRSVRKGSVQGSLARIEKHQQEIEKLLKSDTKIIKQTHVMAKDLQSWSYLMNNRFVKVKSTFGRFKFLRRFIK